MKKRKDSFFGIHFDFHATENQTVGENFRTDIVAELLDKVKPDYVQCDTKGHYGISSYPTKHGTPANIKSDILSQWRKLTKERDIALYAHHSGIFDIHAAKTHPNWAVKDETGNVSESYMSVFSPYSDEILIPQLKEIALDYQLDGAWIDGECWACFVDYSDWAVNAYFKQYKKSAPKSSDLDYEHYKDFCRKGFEDYVNHYISEVKKVNPNFQITSNWMYSSFMPDKMNVNLEFLSGDYSCTNSVINARHESRVLDARNMPWDLMSWGQTAVPAGFDSHDRTTKEYEQYCQEAAMVIAIGGGFEFFNIMYSGGSTVQPWAIDIWQKVGKFLRKREFLYKSKLVHQIGIIYPIEKPTGAQLYTTATRAYDNMTAWNNALLDSGFSTEVVFQSNLNNITDFPVMVLSYAPELQKDVKVFENYVKNGGNLIVDLKSAPYFLNFANLTKTPDAEKLFFVGNETALASVNCDFTTFDGDYVAVSKAYPTNYHTNNPSVCAINKKIGKGTITFLCFDFASHYNKNVSSIMKKFVRTLVNSTGFKPLAQVEGSSYAQLSITKKDNKTIVSINNLAGDSQLPNVRAWGEVPKIGPLKVKLRMDNVKKVTRMPENRDLKIHYENGTPYVKLNSVHIHTALVIE